MSTRLSRKDERERFVVPLQAVIKWRNSGQCSLLAIGAAPASTSSFGCAGVGQGLSRKEWSSSRTQGCGSLNSATTGVSYLETVFQNPFTATALMLLHLGCLEKKEKKPGNLCAGLLVYETFQTENFGCPFSGFKNTVLAMPDAGESGLVLYPK